MPSRSMRVPSDKVSKLPPLPSAACEAMALLAVFAA